MEMNTNVHPMDTYTRVSIPTCTHSHERRRSSIDNSSCAVFTSTAVAAAAIVMNDNLNTNRMNYSIDTVFQYVKTPVILVTDCFSCIPTSKNIDAKETQKVMAQVVHSPDFNVLNMQHQYVQRKKKEISLKLDEPGSSLHLGDSTTIGQLLDTTGAKNVPMSKNSYMKARETNPCLTTSHTFQGIQHATLDDLGISNHPPRRLSYNQDISVPITFLASLLDGTRKNKTIGIGTSSDLDWDRHSNENKVQPELESGAVGSSNTGSTSSVSHSTNQIRAAHRPYQASNFPHGHNNDDADTESDDDDEFDVDCDSFCDASVREIGNKQYIVQELGASYFFTDEEFFNHHVRPHMNYNDDAGSIEEIIEEEIIVETILQPVRNTLSTELQQQSSLSSNNSTFRSDYMKQKLSQRHRLFIDPSIDTNRAATSAIATMDDLSAKNYSMGDYQVIPRRRQLTNDQGVDHDDSFSILPTSISFQTASNANVSDVVVCTRQQATQQYSLSGTNGFVDDSDCDSFCDAADLQEADMKYLEKELGSSCYWECPTLVGAAIQQNDDSSRNNNSLSNNNNNSSYNESFTTKSFSGSSSRFNNSNGKNILITTIGEEEEDEDNLGDDDCSF
jgi:hypothetical protein